MVKKIKIFLALISLLVLTFCLLPSLQAFDYCYDYNILWYNIDNYTESVSPDTVDILLSDKVEDYPTSAQGNSSTPHYDSNGIMTTFEIDMSSVQIEDTSATGKIELTLANIHEADHAQDHLTYYVQSVWTNPSMSMWSEFNAAEDMRSEIIQNNWKSSYGIQLGNSATNYINNYIGTSNPCTRLTNLMNYYQKPKSTTGNTPITMTTTQMNQVRSWVGC
jgi:hypothetical protein